MTANERENTHYQGIDISTSRHVKGLRVGNASAHVNFSDAALSKLMETGSTFHLTSNSWRVIYHSIRVD